MKVPDQELGPERDDSTTSKRIVTRIVTYYCSCRCPKRTAGDRVA